MVKQSVTFKQHYISVTFKQHYMSKPPSKLEIWYINLITSGRLESLCREWWRKFLNVN